MDCAQLSIGIWLECALYGHVPDEAADKYACLLGVARSFGDWHGGCIETQRGGPFKEAVPKITFVKPLAPV